MRFRDPFDDKPPRRDYDSDDRERRSWRDIDAQKNRSRHVSEDKPETRGSRTAQRGEALAKKALQDLFQPKKSKEQRTAWKKVCEAKGSLFAKRSNAYIDKYGMPREWDDLLRLLDLDDDPLLPKVLDKMMDLAPKESAVRRDLFSGKLRVLKMTAEDPRFIEKLENSQKKLAALE